MSNFELCLLYNKKLIIQSVLDNSQPFKVYSQYVEAIFIKFRWLAFMFFLFHCIQYIKLFFFNLLLNFPASLSLFDSLYSLNLLLLPEELRFCFHRAEDPVLSKVPLTLLHESFKFNIVLMVFEIEPKRHRGINFCKMDLFGCALVKFQMILLNQPLVTWYSI